MAFVRAQLIRALGAENCFLGNDELIFYMPRSNDNYASVNSGIGAYAVGALILFIAFPIILRAICGFVLYLTIGLDWMQNGFLFWLYIFTVVSIPFWLYYSLLESSTRQVTFGMRLFGLQVADIEGKRISFGRALLRTIIKLLPFELNHLVLFLPTPIWGEPESRISHWVCCRQCADNFIFCDNVFNAAQAKHSRPCSRNDCCQCSIKRHLTSY